jgi:hypothetical protein
MLNNKLKKTELLALADKYCVASFDCSCRYEHKELETALWWVKLQNDKKEFYWQVLSTDTVKELNIKGLVHVVIPAPSLQELILIATSISDKTLSESVLIAVNKEFILQASINKQDRKSVFIDRVATAVLGKFKD